MQKTSGATRLSAHGDTPFSQSHSALHVTTYESGQGMTEYIVLFVFLIGLIALATWSVSQHPEFAKNSLLIALTGAALAALGYTVKQLIGHNDARARLLVIELLSRSGSDGLDRREILQSLRRESIMFRLSPGLGFDALAQLVGEKILTVHESRYVIAEKKE